MQVVDGTYTEFAIELPVYHVLVYHISFFFFFLQGEVSVIQNHAVVIWRSE